MRRLIFGDFFRLMSPYIGELLKLSNRTMYLASIIILSLCRARKIILYSHIYYYFKLNKTFQFQVKKRNIFPVIMSFLEYKYVMVIGMFLGMAKGVRTVFMPLILPSLVPLHRLPAAIGLLMVMKAIAFLTLGPLFGN